jgi:glycosyltransferase involved in cell wall biosynthesis
VRLYYKLALSFAKQHEVWLISTEGVVNQTRNPYQLAVDADSNWNAIGHLQRKVQELKPDVLICVEPLTLLVGIRLKKRMHLKVIFDVHEFYADAFGERFPIGLRLIAKYAYLAVLKHLQKSADALLSVNPEILTQLLGNDSAKRGTVIPNYPAKHVWDYACDTPGLLSHICEMNFDLIYIGGLTKNRGLFKILKLASILKLEFPNLKILILGKFFDPALEAQFHSSINDFNLNAIIFYQQWIPSEKIGLLLRRSRFGLWLFNPRSKRFKLSTPLKVLEYMAAGLPVITVKTPLMKALVDYNGLGICSGYKAKSLAEATAQLLRMKPAEYNEMSQRCLKITENRFNWEALEPQLFGVLERITKP